MKNQPTPGVTDENVLLSISLNPASERPLYLQLRDQITEAIASQGLLPGTRLPSESRLQRAFNISRATVRQAFSELRQSGLICSAFGRGHFVADGRTTQPLQVLQGLGEALGPAGIKTTAQVISFKEVAPTAQVSSGLALEPDTLVTEIVRVRYSEGQELSLDYTYLPSHLGRLFATHELEGDIFPLIEYKTGTSLGTADLKLSAGLPGTDAQRHLALTPGSPVLDVRRLVKDEHSRPVDFELLTFRGDRYEMALTLSRT